MMFDKAQFGDRFKTRRGELAIYYGKKMGGYHVLYTKNTTFIVDEDGRQNPNEEFYDDIVGLYD